jgi:putative ABC transport system substrate-binding protein
MTSRAQAMGHLGRSQKRWIPSFAFAAAIIFHLAGLSMAWAQPDGKVYRIGILSATPHPLGMDDFLESLRVLGYIERQNVVFESRSAEGRFERLPALAAELVRLRVDVIVAAVTQASLAAKNATTTIPIVMLNVGDPVGAGLVRSLARPGGNVTGTSVPLGEAAAKALEVLKQILPALRRVAVLRNPANAVFQAQLVKETEAAAQSLKIQLLMFEAGDVIEIDRAFERIVSQRPEALIVIPDPVFTVHRAQIAALAVKHRLPSVSAVIEYADAGLLAAYAPSFSELGARAAAQVDKILKGAKAGDLPVEQATKYELVVNLKTAKSIGLTIPPSVSLRAHRVIE